MDDLVTHEKISILLTLIFGLQWMVELPGFGHSGISDAAECEFGNLRFFEVVVLSFSLGVFLFHFQLLIDEVSVRQDPAGFSKSEPRSTTLVHTAPNNLP